MTGTLNIVSTPIGNYSDMTIRAIRILTECDQVICEEYREASKLLRFFEIKKDLRLLNEHNETEESEELFLELLNGKNLALISDCGAPLFSDPGKLLLQKCIEANIKVDFFPGANSVMASIVLAGFDISRFFYYGFLSPKADTRKSEMMKLGYLDKPLVLMEAPYRLKAILKDISDVFSDRKVFVGFNVTMAEEKQFRGTASEILEQIGEENLKGEFVIVVDKLYDKHNQIQS